MGQPTYSRQDLIDRYNETIVDEAEAAYETDFDKFFYDLSASEQIDYCEKVKTLLQ